MIYVCIPSHNEAPTVGLLLWKIRQVFAAFPREYHLLVLDDGRRDTTVEVLEPYSRVLPLTVLKHPERLGYAASVETLLRRAVELTDRPKRDAAVLMHADFAHNPRPFPISFAGSIAAPTSWSRRAAWLAIGRGASDCCGGTRRCCWWRRHRSGHEGRRVRFAIFRLVVLRNAIGARRDPSRLRGLGGQCGARSGGPGRTPGWVERLRRSSAMTSRGRTSRVESWGVARELWSARAKLRATPIAPAPPEPTPRREAERQAEAVS